jgi:hypothetical protein
LDAVRLAQLETSSTPFNEAGRDPWKLGELRRGYVTSRATSDDEDVELTGKVVRRADLDAGGGLDSRIARHVAVVVELHETLLKLTLEMFRSPGRRSIIERTVLISNECQVNRA